MQPALPQLWVKTDDFALRHIEINADTVQTDTLLHLVAVHLFPVDRVQRVVQQLLRMDTQRSE